jgi:hypothetical protein
MYAYCIAGRLTLRDTGGERTVVLFSTRGRAERYCERVGVDAGRVRPLSLLKLVAVLVRQRQRGTYWLCCDPGPSDKFRVEIARFLNARCGGHPLPLRDAVAPVSEN